MRKISRRSFIKAATFTAAAAALTACGGSSSSTTTASSTAASAAADNTPSNKGTGVTLNVYTNSDTDGRDEWLIERAAQDGFKVQVVGAGAADTQNRLLAEKASPIADVVFGLNAIIWESLKAENILIPFVPEWADEIIIKIPFTLRMTKAAFFSLDDSLEDAARNMGAKPFYTFMRVQLPIILPTVLAIFALNFNGLLGDYDMSVFMYHPLNKPLGVYIKSLTDSETNADNAALTFVYAVLMMIISGVVMYLVYGRGNKVDKSKD